MSLLKNLKKLLAMDKDTLTLDEADTAKKEVLANDKMTVDEKLEALKEIDKKTGDNEPEKDEKTEKNEVTKDSEPCAAEGGKQVAMDSAKIVELQQQIEQLKSLEVENQSKEKAISSYEKLYGKANRMAMDSADNVYNAILKNNNIAFDGKTLKEKEIMVDTILNLKTTQAKPLAMDNAPSNDNLLGKKYTDALFNNGSK